MAALKTLNEELLRGLAPGTWVAISRDQERVAGTGATIEDAIKSAKENGEQTPFIIRVPSENASLIV
jgi:predicted RNase H-like HicB family nuclease